jgi:hypothetical protein
MVDCFDTSQGEHSSKVNLPSLGQQVTARLSARKVCHRWGQSSRSPGQGHCNIHISVCVYICVLWRVLVIFISVFYGSVGKSNCVTFSSTCCRAPNFIFCYEVVVTVQ